MESPASPESSLATESPYAPTDEPVNEAVVFPIEESAPERVKVAPAPPRNDDAELEEFLNDLGMGDGTNHPR
jgi:hypothetical protein